MPGARDRAARRRVLAFAAAASIAAAECAHRYDAAPAPWLPHAHDLPRWPYGASAVVHPTDRKSPAIRGELIALDRDSVYILADTALIAVACRTVRGMDLQVDVEGMLEAPQLAFARSKVDRPFGIGDKRVGPDPAGPIPAEWEKVRPFARFPGGLPDSLDRASLRLPPARR